MATTVNSYTFQINLNGDHAEPVAAWPEDIKVGDRVKFASKDGEPRVVFEGTNPFSLEPGFIVSSSDDFHEVLCLPTKANPAQAYCWVKPAGKDTYIGYGPSSPKHSGYTIPPPSGH